MTDWTSSAISLGDDKVRMFEILVLLAEFALSAYPILIKRVTSPLWLQTGVRMIVFTVLAALVGWVTGSGPMFGTLGELVGLGALNLAHVSASYKAFADLPAGNAIALFYTYPIWNLLGAVAVLGESFPTESLPWIGLAVLGTILIAQPTTGSWTAVGVTMALLAALTETAIYLWFRKSGASETWTNMTTMYGGSGVLWGAASFLRGSTGTTRGTADSPPFSNIVYMILFNALVGFIGYAARFFAIPYVRTAVFSVLSFVGVLAAYMFGWLFVGEVPSKIQMLGASLIIASNIFLLKS